MQETDPGLVAGQMPVTTPYTNSGRKGSSAKILLTWGGTAILIIAVAAVSYEVGVSRERKTSTARENLLTQRSKTLVTQALSQQDIFLRGTVVKQDASGITLRLVDKREVTFPPSAHVAVREAASAKVSDVKVGQRVTMGLVKDGAGRVAAYSMYVLQ